MSAVDTRMERPRAVEIAKRFVALLEGTYDDLVVAGSLRRRLATIGDLEVVARPKIEQQATGLFADVTEEVDLLGARLEALLADGVIAKRPRSDGTTFWGPSAKYLTFEGAPVDLFSPREAERWGLILAMRTGPAAWSNALVTPKGMKTRGGRDGMLPPIYRVRGGWLTWKVSGQRIETPDEASLFARLGSPYLEPWERV